VLHVLTYLYALPWPLGLVNMLARMVVIPPRGAHRGQLARDLGMPPWKIDRVRQQIRGWTADGVSVALRAVAEADAAVKGGGADPAYALEKAVVTISQASRSGA